MEHGKTEDWLQKVPLFQGLSKKQLRDRGRARIG
jgi:hypothetical protein